MMPKKVLDLRKFPGLPQFLVFTDDSGFYQPYSSWDSVNNSRRLVQTDTFRRYDVIFSSVNVRDRFLEAIKWAGCVKAKYPLCTSSCVVYVLDVINPDTFAKCYEWAPVTSRDYVLILHEVAGTYQIVSGNGTEVFGYLTEDLTYDRR